MTDANDQISPEMRDLAEKSVDQARKAFDSFIGAARRTTDTLRSSAELAHEKTQTMSSRGFAYAEQNVNAAFDLAQKLVRANDPQEALQLQAEFARTQFAAMEAQAKELGGMAQSALRQTTESFGSVSQQGADELKKTVDEGVSTAAAAEKQTS